MKPYKWLKLVSPASKNLQTRLVIFMINYPVCKIQY